MSNTNCYIVNDLLPLYQEGMLSPETTEFVNEHLTACSKCNKKLLELKENIVIPIEADITPLKKLKNTLLKKKMISISFTFLFAIFIGILSFIYLTAPIPIEYQPNLLNIEELDKGNTLISFNQNIANYEFSVQQSSQNIKANESIYHITAWDTLWNRIFQNNKKHDFMIETKDLNAFSIYYYSGMIKDRYSEPDIEIYKKGTLIDPDYSQGNVITLPRLVLSYYFLIALVLLTLSFICYFVFRNNKKAKNIITNIGLIPLSYLVSSLCVKGFDFSTHTLLKDFTGILLLSIPIYFISLMIKNLIQIKYLKKHK